MNSSDWFLLLIFACALAGLLLIVLSVFGNPSSRRASSAPRRIGSRVTVHTKLPDDYTFFGVLIGDWIDRIELVDAEFVTKDGNTPLPGRQHISTSQISWIDVHQLVATHDQLAAHASEEDRRSQKG